MNTPLTLSLTLATALALVGCGGSSSSDSEDNGNDAVVQGFTAKAQWAITPVAGSSTCFDFDGNAEADCAGNTWDMKLSLGTGARDSAKFYTNSGPVATGKGGALGDIFTHSWATLEKFKGGTTDDKGEALLSPMFSTDSMANGFSDDTPYGAFAYADQKIHSKYSVYLVTSDHSQAFDAASDHIYAVQLVDYYGGATGSVSGYPKVRYVKLSDSGTVQEKQVNASKAWTYLNLETGAEVGKTDVWHLGFSRYNIITNSGASGEGKVGSFLAQKAAGFYTAEGDVDTSKLTDDTLRNSAKALLTDSSGWSTPASASKWVKDSLVSPLSPAYQGDLNTGFDYGFYLYTAMNASHPAGMHKFVAKPENAVLLRSGEGDTYARVHLSSLVDGLYTFDFDVAPKVAQ